MEGIDLLQNLNEQRETLFDAVKAQETQLNEKLFTFFKSISEYNGLEMMPLHCKICKPWFSDEKNNLFEIELTIRFFDETGAKWPSGERKADFGSDILLYIFNNHIKMNYGTCGSYTNKDKGQMTRAFLVAKLWENEDTICSIAKATINMNDYDELQEVRYQMERINSNIKAAQIERERQEILSKIRTAKFICKRRKHEINGRWDDLQNKYVNDGYEWVYYDYELIKKVTDSNVLTADTYLYSHRRNLNNIISDLIGGYLFLRDEKIDKEPILEENSAE